MLSFTVSGVFRESELKRVYKFVQFTGEFNHLQLGCTCCVLCVVCRIAVLLQHLRMNAD